MTKEPKVQLLLVDDNRAARDAFHALLEALGYIVHSAADGPQALRLVRSVLFDLAIVDLYLPGMNGYTLCEELQKELLPVILISGAPGAIERELAHVHGAAAFLGKPFVLTEITECIEQVLRSQQKSRPTPKNHQSHQ